MREAVLGVALFVAGLLNSYALGTSYTRKILRNFAERVAID